MKIERSMRRREFVTFGAAGYALTAGVVQAQTDGGRIVDPDLARVQERLVSSFTSTADGASELSVDELLGSLGVDGQWRDINEKYPPPGQAGVGRYVHCLRLWKLCAAWSRESSGAHRRGALTDALSRAYPVWLDKPAPPSIPWFQEIGTPQALARATLIIREQLSPDQIACAIRILRTCVLPDGTLDYAGSPATGQNLQHEAEIQIVAGCLSGDAEYLARHAQLIEAEVNRRDVEGVQVDWSFHQHGPQLYSGALYGTGFARDGAKLAWVLGGTRFAFRPATVEALVSYVLEGQQWMARGWSFDHLTAGRLVAWPNFMGVEPEGDQGVAEACDHLARLHKERRAELLAFAARLRRHAPPVGGPAGNRVFWMSDYVCHRRPGYFASVRMTSRRVYGAESGNGQNDFGYHLADGGMSVMLSGDEYHDIFPIWDWRRVPGVSAVQNPAVPLPRHQWGRGSEGWSDFAGGVSDGTVGAAGMEQNRAGLYVKKAWFFLDDLIYCLGTDLRPHDPAFPVFTSVDQRWGRGAVRCGSHAGTAELRSGETHSLRSAGWVHHDNITYVFPVAAAVRVRFERRSAPWSVINTAAHGSMFRRRPLTDLTATGDVFSVWLDHGAGIGKAVTYQYAILPNRRASELTAGLPALPTVVSNNAGVQAIALPKVVQAVFWHEGKLELPDGRAVRVNRPCIVQLREDSAAGGRTTIAAGNPTHREGAVLVEILDSAGRTSRHAFEFPAGPYCGRPQLLQVS